ncbi:MAG: NERD domain-containing protein [Chromatiaceae bacterium]|nr:NERD domain-containing protein [Chromatiaceae bacterium]
MTSKMEVQIWDGGLTLHEINAIERIETVFCAGCGKDKPPQPSRGGSLREQLGQATGRSSSRMWPWKGYAGFRFFDSKGYEGEFDLVLVTHCLVLIVELKHWNGDLTSSDGNWYLNSREMGRSPVAVTQNKQYLLKKKLDKFGGRFRSLKGSRFPSPKVEFRVVLTGSATPENLPESDRFKTMALDEFLSLADERNFNDVFRPHPASHGTNKDIPLFDEIFSEKQTRPKHLLINGYMAVEKIFPLNDDEHVYKEFKAVSEANKSDEALLRQWNFSKIPDPTAKTPEGRFKIVSREQDVLSFIKNHDYDLYQHCLRSLKTISPQEVTQQFHELYELPAGHSRFNEFVGRHLESMPEDGRVALVKILLDFFAKLHAIKVAHRDIADHSLWVSPSKNIAVSSFIAAYHQPIGTVGEPRAALSVRAIPLPECDAENSKANTPFADDVYYLGILAWLILKAKRLSERSLKEIEPDLAQLGAWYSPIIEKAVENNPADRYADASAFFEAFTGSVPQGKAIEIFDESDLEPFRTSIRLHKEFPDDEYLLDGEIKEVYRSGDCVVKLWNDISPNDKTPEIGAKVVHFLKRVESLRSMQPDYLPTIRDFGLATRTSQLYLVQDFAEGRPWSELVANAKELPVENRIAISIKLVDAVEHLHDLNSYHGDLHPENVLIVSGETEDDIFLIDTPDFDFLSGEARNHRYSPEAIDASSPIDRDNYGATRLCAELLELDWTNPTCIDGPLTDIAEAIRVEKVSESGFASLSRLKDALTGALEDKPAEPVVSVGMRNPQVRDSLSILPDNGNIYVSVTKFKKEPGKVVVSLFGIGGQLRAVYDPEKALVDFCYPPKRIAEIHPRVRDNADFLIDARVTVGSESLIDSMN